MSINKINFIGNLTRDPEMKEVNGASCANFTVASDTRMKGNDDKPITNFYNCTAWRQAGETIAKYLKKGSKIAITGDLVIRPYKDNNGNDRTSVCVTVNDFEFLTSRSQNEGGNNNGGGQYNNNNNGNGYRQPQPQPQNNGYVPVGNEFIPF